MSNVVQIEKYRRRKRKLSIGKVWVWPVLIALVIQSGIIYLMLGKQ